MNLVSTIPITTGKASKEQIPVAMAIILTLVSSLFWMDHFGDPTYQYHVALTQIWGLMALHLSSDRLLNMNVKPYAAFIAEHYRALKSLVPLRDFSNLESAVDNFMDAADILDAEVLLYRKKGSEISPIGDMNSRLALFERRFIDPEGIQGRDWFKHVIIGQLVEAS